MYEYGLIGNCQISALISKKGSIDWLCLPRPDDPPVFGKLLDPNGGSFSIEMIGPAESTQKYIVNTNILQTIVTQADGQKIEITDFCPRFLQYGRVYRPIALFRIIKPLVGNPIITISCNPIQGWNKTPLKAIRGNSHLRYEYRGDDLRLTTNMSLTYLTEGTAFAIIEPLCFALTWGHGIEDDLPRVTSNFLEQTLQYWQSWVKSCSIPSSYQMETIRSALTLKLHCYEDTGAILAALTTSLPEEHGASRNWDYRFCWPRDAYFTLSAFYNLGQYEEMEGFLRYLLGIAEQSYYLKDQLRPVYRLDQSVPSGEEEHSNWAGHKDSAPVRSNNQAAEHVQNDIYGEMLLILAPIFLDERFQHLRNQHIQKLLFQLVNSCKKMISKPDAGLWEFRNGWKVHAFSNLMCWAGINRANKFRASGILKFPGHNLEEAEAFALQELMLSVKNGVMRSSTDDNSALDASLLLLPMLGYPDKVISSNTVSAITNNLVFCDENNKSYPGFYYRYTHQDDFGAPKSAFTICSFWAIQAMIKLNRKEESKEIMQMVMGAANHLGLFSEHFIPSIKAQRGNFPQAYSHVGQINASFSISDRWEDVL
ncbi:MAG: glycoside hydrolase family 15 protein [Oligoflexia bacterium]|nr:glycoside hydrolase family 15 protein [Oligoflexia bacterium]MBF0364493.1 glycoside hydrolase family 15 protein [Oligoflexia bacterium]